MELTKISVIIPVYNVKPYLSRCIDSVLKQTYTNLEIILIDDGSTDGSGEICDDYQSKDKRVMVYHCDNAGQSNARNIGIDYATGEWVAFLDSDDWIEPEMYKELLHAAVSTGLEISSCLTKNCYMDHIDNSEIFCKNEDEIISILSIDEIIEGLYTQDVRFEVWNKLWKRSLIGDVRFKMGQLGEEVYFDRVLFLKAGHMVVVNKVLHNYLARRPGNTNSTFKIARLCIFEEFNALIEDLNNSGKLGSAKTIGCIALDYSISIYTNAVQTKQNKETRDYLISQAYKYYHITKNSCRCRRFITKVGAWIFIKNPQVYLIIRKIKRY